MKDKLLTLYLGVFLLFVFISSAMFMYELIAKLNLPSGIISIIVNYGYFLVHIASFVAMFHYKDKLIKTEKGE